MSLPKSSEKTNCRNGDPLPQQGSFSPDSAWGGHRGWDTRMDFGRWGPTPDGMGASRLTLGLVHLVDQARNDVAILHIEVVMRPIDVGGDDAGELAAVLLVVCPG